MLTMICHGVEFSIVRGVVEMVYELKSLAFFFLFFFFFLVSCALFYYFPCLLGTKTTCSASYGKAKPL